MTYSQTMWQISHVGGMIVFIHDTHRRTAVGERQQRKLEACSPGMRINCTFYIYRTLIKQPIIKHSWSVYYHCIVKYIVVFMGLHWIFESREFPNHTSLSGNTFGNNVHVSSNISDPWNKVYDVCLWQARYVSIFHYHIYVLNGDFPL